MLRFISLFLSMVGATPALAASQQLDLTLRIDAIYWAGVTIQDRTRKNEFDNYYRETFSRYDKGSGEYDKYFDHPLAAYNVGDLINFNAMILPSNIGSTGEAPECYIGGYDCRTRNGYHESVSLFENSLKVVDDYFDSLWSIRTALEIGGRGSHDWTESYGRGWVSSEDSEISIFYTGNRVEFTVIENNLVAAPLPDSLPMLAAGLLGMGWFIRRRRTAGDQSVAFPAESNICS